jgi:hypothetical protein
MEELSPAEEIILAAHSGSRVPTSGLQCFKGVEFHPSNLIYACWTAPPAGRPFVGLRFFWTEGMAEMALGRIRLMGLGEKNPTEAQSRALQVSRMSGQGKVSIFRMSCDPDLITLIEANGTPLLPTRLGADGRTPVKEIEVANLTLHLRYDLDDAWGLFATVWHPDLILAELP